MKLLSLILIILSAVSVAHADNWNLVSNGESSLKSSFREQKTVYLKPLKGARVVLVNKALAARLGLVAKDDSELERLILEKFAFTTTQKQTNRKGFSTSYAGQGDGRVVWMGEIVIPNTDGTFGYYDFSIKGPGRTPYAREGIPGSFPFYKTTYGQYTDGLQSMEEAAKSFVATQAIKENGIDTVEDLAVIEIPIIKDDTVRKTKEKAAITVRVGNQIRLAHMERDLENPVDEYKPIIRAAARRALRLSPQAPITQKEVEQYASLLINKLARASAAFTDLNFVHGAAYTDNFTSAGEPIDFGTFVAMDAYHSSFAPLNYRVQEEADMMKAGLHLLRGTLFTMYNAEMDSLFDNGYKATLTSLRLKRLGLTDKQIETLPEDLKKPFYNSTSAIAKSSTSQAHQFNGKWTYIASFDLRSILKDTMALLNEKTNPGPEQWSQLFSITTDNESFYDWGAYENSNSALMREYTRSVQGIALFLENQGADMKALATRAARIGSKKRERRVFPDLTSLMAEIQSPKFSFEQNSLHAQQIAHGLVDHGCGEKMESLGTP